MGSDRRHRGRRGRPEFPARAGRGRPAHPGRADGATGRPEDRDVPGLPVRGPGQLAGHPYHPRVGGLRAIRPSCHLPGRARTEPGLPARPARDDRGGPRPARGRAGVQPLVGAGPGRPPDHRRQPGNRGHGDVRHRPGAGGADTGQRGPAGAARREPGRCREPGRRREPGGRGEPGPAATDARGRRRHAARGRDQLHRRGLRRLRGAELRLPERLEEILPLRRGGHLHRRRRAGVRPAEPDRRLGVAAGRGRLALRAHLRRAAGRVRPDHLARQPGGRRRRRRGHPGRRPWLRPRHPDLLRHGGLSARPGGQRPGLPVGLDHPAARRGLQVRRLQQLLVRRRRPGQQLHQVRHAGRDLGCAVERPGEHDRPGDPRR